MLLPACLAAICLPRERPAILGPPLVVGGERVSDEEIERYLVYGPGGPYFEAVLLDALADAELARRGEDEARYSVSDAEVRDRMRRYQQGLRERGYDDLDAQVRRAHGSPVWLALRARATLRFDRVFLPPDPDDWPEITLETLRPRLGEEGWPEWREQLREDYERRRADDAFDPYGEGDWAFVRPLILPHLLDHFEVKTAAEGLPPEDALVVGDRHFSIRELFEPVAPELAEQDVSLTKRWLAIDTAARQRLARNTRMELPRLPNQESLREMWSESYRFEHRLDGFPSFEAYLRTGRTSHGFASLTHEPDTDRAARAWLRKRGRIEAGVLLFSVFDWQTYRWKDDGWASSLAKAERVAREIADHERAFALGEDNQSLWVFWQAVCERESESWSRPGWGMKRLYGTIGRVHTWGRSDLARQLGEGLFWETCLGDTITDRIFFEQEPGTVGGPWKTRFGYALVYLTGRDFPALPSAPVEDDLHADLVPFLRETFDRTEVSGLEAGRR